MKVWLFCGSDRGGERAAVMYSLIVTSKMTTSIRKPGSPTFWTASPSIPSKGSTNSCHGIGAPPSGTLIKPPEPKMTRARSSPDAYVSLSVPIGAEDQAALSTVDCLQRRLPTPEKPRIIMAQVVGLRDGFCDINVEVYISSAAFVARQQDAARHRQSGTFGCVWQQ